MVNRQCSKEFRTDTFHPGGRIKKIPLQIDGIEITEQAWTQSGVFAVAILVRRLESETGYDAQNEI